MVLTAIIVVKDSLEAAPIALITLLSPLDRYRINVLYTTIF